MPQPLLLRPAAAAPPLEPLPLREQDGEHRHERAGGGQDDEGCFKAAALLLHRAWQRATTNTVSIAENAMQLFMWRRDIVGVAHCIMDFLEVPGALMMLLMMHQVSSSPALAAGYGSNSLILYSNMHLHISSVNSFAHNRGRVSSASVFSQH